MLAGCAGWTEMAQKVASALTPAIYSDLDRNVLNEISLTDPRKVISICKAKVSHDPQLERVYFQAIRDSVTPTNESAFAAIHERLFDLKPAAFVTTNIDKGMERVAPAFRVGKEIIDLTKIDADPGDRLRNSNIFYLHGSVDNLDRAVLTLDQYLDFYYSDRRRWVRDFLSQIFSGRFCVLFLGYGLTEYEIIQNIYQAAPESKRGLRENRHFLLTPIYTRDIARFNIERTYFEGVGVCSIPYFIDHEGFPRLNPVLSDLKRKINERTGPLKAMAAIDEV